MTNQLLYYVGAVITIIWGSAHLVPTKNVVKGFGDISADNKKIITMEWIAEGVSLIFIGTIILGVTYIDPLSIISGFVYISSAVILIVLAIVSLFTGFKVNFLPFKLCPVLFTASALLIFFGYLL